MKTPKLTEFSVKIKFACDDKYRTEHNISSKDVSALEPNTPEKAVLAAVYELGRIAELYGVGEDSVMQLISARAKVRVDLKLLS